MTEHAIIAGQLVDAKNVASHKVFRLYIDIPQEQAAMALDAFGWPTMAKPVPVAIARLVENQYATAPGASQKAVGELKPGGSPPGTRGNNADQIKPRSRAQRAGILCNDPRFRRFLGERHSSPNETPLTADIAAEWVRIICLVASRSEFDTDEAAGKRWDMLESAFLAEGM